MCCKLFVIVVENIFLNTNVLYNSIYINKKRLTRAKVNSINIFNLFENKKTYFLIILFLIDLELYWFFRDVIFIVEILSITLCYQLSVALVTSVRECLIIFKRLTGGRIHSRAMLPGSRLEPARSLSFGSPTLFPSRCFPTHARESFSAEFPDEELARFVRLTFLKRLLDFLDCIRVQWISHFACVDFKWSWKPLVIFEFPRNNTFSRTYWFW